MILDGTIVPLFEHLFLSMETHVFESEQVSTQSQHLVCVLALVCLVRRYCERSGEFLSWV